MDLPDVLAVVAGGSAFIGGFAGLVVPFTDGRDWLDNGQRGFFVGAWIGTAGAFVIYLGSQVGA
jgi:hypothetical protein